MRQIESGSVHRRVIGRRLSRTRDIRSDMLTKSAAYCSSTSLPPEYSKRFSRER
jgi:hypothetical protein